MLPALLNLNDMCIWQVNYFTLEKKKYIPTAKIELGSFLKCLVLFPFKAATLWMERSEALFQVKITKQNH